MGVGRAVRGMAWTIGVLGVLGVLLGLAPGAWAGDYDLYYKVVMENAQAGWMHSTQATSDGRITTGREMKFSFKRGETKSSAGITTGFVETSAGKPVSMRSVQVMGAKPVTVEYRFTAEGLEVSSGEGAARKVVKAAAPEGEWLTPAAAMDFLARRLKAGAKQITYRTIDPLSGAEISTVTHADVRAGSVKVGEKTFEGYSMTTTSSTSPGVSSQDFVDGEGNLITQTTAMGGLSVSITLAGPEVVDFKAESPEFMVSTFVKPDKVIVDPRRVSRGTFTLDYGDAAPAVPGTGSQSVTTVAGAKVTIVVDASTPNVAEEADARNAAYRGASAMISSEDARVKALAARGVEGVPENDALGRARALRGAVHEFITNKNLDVGFAAASEVAQTRTGDCTEHAVLLTAVLRAQGIPARVAGGLIYADQFAGSKGIFGYHMWSQALVELDGSLRWLDLDATLPLEPGYDGTHIALVVSGLSDTEGTRAMQGIAAAMGKVKISVGALEHRR